MQVHGPDTAVKAVDVGEYHLGAVAIYLGPIRVVTYSMEDCDALITAACNAKKLHAAAISPGRAALYATVAGLAMQDDGGAP